MAPPAAPRLARVVFDDLLWEEDLARSTPEAASAAMRARAALQRGVPIDRLRAGDRVRRGLEAFVVAADGVDQLRAAASRSPLSAHCTTRSAAARPGTTSGAGCAEL